MYTVHIKLNLIDTISLSRIAGVQYCVFNHKTVYIEVTKQYFMLLATVKGTFKSAFRTETTTIHIYDNDFTKYGKVAPTTKQGVYDYVWSIPGVVKADINYGPSLS